MPTLYVDYENGNDNYAGTSFTPLYSGVDGRISTTTFSSATANFLNDGSFNSKNYVTEAEYLVNGAYFLFARTVTIATNQTPPSGITGTVYSVLETSDLNTHEFRIPSNTPSYTTGQTYTASFYAKPNGRNQIIFRWGLTAAKGARFDLSNGTIAQSGASSNPTINNIGNGWYRISITTTPDNTSDSIYLGLTDGTYTDTAAQTYTGNINYGIYITSPQIETGSSVTTYEKPAPSQFLSIYNGSAYVIYQIVARLSSTTLRITQIPNGTTLADQASDRQFYIGGRWRSLTTGAASNRINIGDTIRTIGSPAPTLVGNATWNSNILQSTKTPTSSTNASPININIVSHGYSTGDTVVITSHTTNTNANGTWEIVVVDANNFTLTGSTGNGVGGATGTVRLRNNTVVRLSSSVTQNIASCGNIGQGRTVWTAQTADIITSPNLSDFKEGDCSDSIGIGVNFTTGLAAYKALGSTLDLSGYQQLSFWIKQTAGTIGASGALSLKLCSDTAGATAVNTFNIENLVLLNRWIPITINLGSNLGSNIQSIGFYINTDNGAQVFLLSNIIACKASSSTDSLNLCSLIGKNISTDTFYGIQSINGTRIMLDQDSSAVPNSANCRGYCDGTISSSTVSTYKRETIKTDMVSGATTQVQNMTKGGAGAINAASPDGLYIKYEGGWDRTNMSAQTLETWFDGRNGYGYGLFFGNAFWNSLNKISFIRYYTGIENIGGWGYILNNSNCNNNSNYGCEYNGSTRITSNNFFTHNNSNVGVVFTNTCSNIINNFYSSNNTGNGTYIWYGAGYGIYNNIFTHNNSNGVVAYYVSSNIIKNSKFNLNSNNGLLLNSGPSNNKFISCSTSGNIAGISASVCGDNFFTNYTPYEATPVLVGSVFSNYKICSQNHNNTPNYSLITCEWGTIYSTISTRSGISWALAPTSTYRDSTFPLDLKIATVAVNANSLVTVRAWLRRSSIGLTMGLRVKANQISGVTNDITSYMTAAADTWEQVSLSFTPTETGVVEILAECWGGTTFTGYVDDISITQV